MRVHFEDGGGGGGEPRPGGGDAPDRPWKRAVLRGLGCRCPACGTGSVFTGYLKIAPVCAACGEELHHHRADDLPAYLTILVVGHVVVSGLLVTERLFRPEIGLQMAIWLSLSVVLALTLVRPIKGAVVGLQWALRMHGFGGGLDRSRGMPRGTS